MVRHRSDFRCPGWGSRGVFGASGGFGIRFLEPRVAQPRRLRRDGRALGRLVPRHDAQVHALQVPRQHLAGGTQRPDRGQLLVRDRLRLRGDLLTESGQATLPRRPPRGASQRRAAPGCLGSLADPVVNVHDRLDNLRKLSGILLDAGSHDDYNLHWGHRVLSHRLREAGIAHEFLENTGNHGGRWPSSPILGTRSRSWTY